MRLRAAAWFLPFVFIVWSVYFVPLLLNSRPSTGTNVKAAVLTKITFHTREGVTQEEARLALIKVVSKHFEDVLHVELKEHLQKSRGTTTTVPIFLWFRSVKEANAKKTVLEQNKSELELELQVVKTRYSGCLTTPRCGTAAKPARSSSGATKRPRTKPSADPAPPPAMAPGRRNEAAEIKLCEVPSSVLFHLGASKLCKTSAGLLILHSSHDCRSQILVVVHFSSSHRRNPKVNDRRA
jgi:hypothetical protein